MPSDTSPRATSSDAAASPESAYHDLRHLIPSLAGELNSLRTSLREHNLWLLRYGHSATTDAPPATTPVADGAEQQPPSYTPSDVPPYNASLPSVQSSTRDDVEQRRDQIIEWLREGEDVLRDYSARFAQLGQDLNMPYEDLLGTWTESNPDNSLPGYIQVEESEDLMVGGVGEVPPPYIRGADAPSSKTR